MSDKYFVMFLGALAILLIAVLAYWRCYIKLRYLQKLARINILKRQQLAGNNCLYSSKIINDCVKKIYCIHSKKARHALAFLVGGRPQKAVQILKSRFFFAALLLQAHYDPISVFKHMQKHKKLWRDHRQYNLYFPLLAHKMFATEEFLFELQKIIATTRQKHALQNLAYYKYLYAQAALQEGDMLSASTAASQALKLFQKMRFFPEEAECYLLLGEIYRLSCVNDVAQTMIETAAKIYKRQNLDYYYAKAQTILGMLMFFQNRIDEARMRYKNALKIADNPLLQADIHNQNALLEITEGNQNAAEKSLKIAQRIHRKYSNFIGLAYNRQLMAHLALLQNKYAQASKYAAAAYKMYLRQKNYSACCECLYVQAQSLCRLCQYVKAERILRNILKISNRHSNNFHISTVYSLLALIYMQTGDLPRAKILLQQSVMLEQRHNRCRGLAADYVNLAVIAQIANQPDEVIKNLQAAAEYAKNADDNELIALIENKLKNTI